MRAFFLYLIYYFILASIATISGLIIKQTINVVYSFENIEPCYDQLDLVSESLAVIGEMVILALCFIIRKRIKKILKNKYGVNQII
jgi:hypothetical protein